MNKSAIFPFFSAFMVVFAYSAAEANCKKFTLPTDMASSVHNVIEMIEKPSVSGFLEHSGDSITTKGKVKFVFKTVVDNQQYDYDLKFSAPKTDLKINGNWREIPLKWSGTRNGQPLPSWTTRLYHNDNYNDDSYTYIVNPVINGREVGLTLHASERTMAVTECIDHNRILGDFNDDGCFNSDDLIYAFTYSYLWGGISNLTTDLVAALQQGQYESGECVPR